MEVKSIAQVKYNYNLDGVNLTNKTTSNIINTEVRKVALQIKKIASSQYFIPNDIICYTLILSNTGNYKATNIIIEDDITNQDYINLSLKFYSLCNEENNTLVEEIINNKLVLKLKYMNPQETFIITYKTRINQNVEEITSPISVISEEILKKEKSETSVKLGFANIECTKSVSSDITYINNSLTYILKLRNIGNISATNVEVFDELPVTYELDKTKPVQIQNNPIEYKYENNILSFTIPEIKPYCDINILVNGRITN